MEQRVVYREHGGQAGVEPFLAFDLAHGEAARAFHESIEGYTPTPLVGLDNLAGWLGLRGLYVKDESRRFGLNAFKGLGGSYCLGRYLSERLGAGRVLSYRELKARGGEDRLTFVTATDGNHGRGIAWAAAQLGHRAVVYMPKGSSPRRLEHIRALGAQAEITEYNYDDTVRFASRQAQQEGWVLVQDTAWPGYETLPTYIMEGYLTMGVEAVEQLGRVRPTHIFLQAGVGAMSGALTAFFRAVYGWAPKIVIVEPDGANCIFRTAQADDGTLHVVKGALDTIMAGLACGEPCTIGWDLLREGADAFLSIPDTGAARGMRVLGNPLPGDGRIISGESGAAGFGGALELLLSPELAADRRKLGLNEEAVVLCVSTEGDTDEEHYRKVVWDGWYSNEQ